MGIYQFLENPRVYNVIEKILGLNNKSCERCLLELIPSKEDDLILDVGCGTARYANLLKGKYYGTDINPDYIKFAKEKYSGDFSVMDASRMGFPDNMFDYVFNVGIFHHMPDETVYRALGEMKRLCKPGGKVFVIEAVYPPKINLIGYLLFRFDRGEHTRTLNELSKIMAPQGYKLLKNKIKGSYPYRLCVFTYEK